ncbi:hypothetical protein [Spirosoma spitsbergense]|uniref:hypothetical protein n=1 Tax=Spirosoma spitsbergense TaxID=431554 RepID=UPI00036A85E3|nr:hypothetical protein [Spirosoma spitsbergense]
MKSLQLNTKWPLVIAYGLLVGVFSCEDHRLPVDLPESACLAVDGSPRTYPCEFVIDKLTFLAKDGTTVAEVTPTSPVAILSREKAKSEILPGSSGVGAVTYDVRATIRRVANPSFPVTAGYLLSATTNTARERILHTPGERYFIGSPIRLDMLIGNTSDVTFELQYLYRLTTVGGVLRPVLDGPATNIFFVENDNTTFQFNRTINPYRFVGSVVESYIKINASVAP